MGIVVMPITRIVGIYPTIKVPWSFGIDDKTFVASAQEIAANSLYRLSVASFWCSVNLAHWCTLMDMSVLVDFSRKFNLTRFYQCLRLCSCGTKPQRSENRHFVMTSSWEPQCHHDIIMRTPRIMGKPKFSCSGGL